MGIAEFVSPTSTSDEPSIRTVHWRKNATQSVGTWSASSSTVLWPRALNVGSCTAAATNALCAASSAKTDKSFRWVDIWWHYWCILEPTFICAYPCRLFDKKDSLFSIGLWTHKIFQATDYSCKQTSRVWLCGVWGTRRRSTCLELVKWHRIAGFGGRLCE